MDRESAHHPSTQVAETCTAIVVHGGGGATTGDAGAPGAASAAGRPTHPMARKVTRSELAWELIDLTEGMSVRHGVLGDQSRAFACPHPRSDERTDGRWIDVNSDRFQQMLSGICYQQFGRGPIKAVLEEVIAHLRGRAFCLPPDPIARRLIALEGSLWLSLGPESPDFVEITPHGWHVVPDAPALFLHSEGAGALPVPQRGGHINMLKRYFPNVPTADWPSLVGFILSTYLPDGPLPILALSGPKGVGKSIATELVTALCDPVIGLDARSTLPEKVEDLFTIAGSAHLLTFDNTSKLDASISDALCTITTGAARKARRLYTQGSLHTLRARNPILINGISTGIEREDLVSRTVFIELQPIPEVERRKESTLRQDFQRELPLILGAILDGVVLALRDGAATTVSPPHRLEDAACFVTAAEPALKLPDGSIVSAWIRSQSTTHQDLGGTDPVVEVLQRRMSKTTEWTGTASDFVKQAAAMEEGDDGTPLPRDFPRTAARLGEHLRRQRDVLARAGFEVSRSRVAQERWIQIKRIPQSAQVSTVSVTRPRSGAGR